MHKILIAGLMIGTALSVAGCSGSDAVADTREARGDATPATRTYDLADFTGIELAGPDDVVVRRGAAFAVSARGPASAIERLVISVDGNTLRVRRRGSIGWSSDDDGATVTVTMPVLTKLALAGSGTLTADTLTGARAAVDLAGSGDIAVTNVSATALELAIGGSGDISVAGTARSVDASVAGSGDISGSGLTAPTADVSVAGSGDVALTVTQTADISMIGSGDVTISGGARCTTSAIGSGTARCN
jgi:hypothetical protein